MVMIGVRKQKLWRSNIFFTKSNFPRQSEVCLLCFVCFLSLNIYRINVKMLQVPLYACDCASDNALVQYTQINTESKQFVNS